MPTPPTSSQNTHVPHLSDNQRASRAQLFLGAGFMAIVMFFGLIVWRLVQLPHSGRPAATPHHRVAAEERAERREPISATPDPIVIDVTQQERDEPVRKEPAVVAAVPELPRALTSDEVVENRLRASEDDLRAQLRDIPELRVLDDGYVKKFRFEEVAGLAPREFAAREMEKNHSNLEDSRTDLENAKADLEAVRAGKKRDLDIQEATQVYDEAVLDYQEAVRRDDEVTRLFQQASPVSTRRLSNIEEMYRMRYEYNRRLHQTMKKAGVQAGLALGSGPSCQLNSSTAGQVAKLSKAMRDKGFVNALGSPTMLQLHGADVRINGKPIPILSRTPNPRYVDANVAIIGNRFYVKGRRLLHPALRNSGGVYMDGDVSNTTLVRGGREIRRIVPGVFEGGDGSLAAKVKAFQTWCDGHQLETMSGGVPTLTQMLQIEDEAIRLLLVRELTKTKSSAATVELAIRAIADLSLAVRQAALAGLEQRPASEYLPTLLCGLRYPWSPIADHAAFALRTLKPQEAVASMVDLIDLPSPSVPVYDSETKQYTVREMVRLNHLRNCLLCHAPSANPHDGLLRGVVPTPGQPLSNQYYESPDGDFVRADITFLRQDFSIHLPEKDAPPWPDEQRYDFVTRLRTVTPNEAMHLLASSTANPQREAVLYALRGITGKDGGTSSALWCQLLGISTDKPSERKKNPVLENIAISTTDPNRSR